MDSSTNAATTLMPPLPDGSAAAVRELRTRMTGEWRPLLEGLSFPVVVAEMSVLYESTPSESRGQLAVGFGKYPQSEWGALEQEFARVAASHGWTVTTSTRGTSIGKPGYGLIGGCTILACSWHMITSPTGRALDPDVQPGMVGKVPELAPPILVPHGMPATLTPGEPTSEPPLPRTSAPVPPTPTGSTTPAAFRDEDTEHDELQERPRLNMS